MKKLLVLGGIALSKAIIESAKDMGIYTCVTDYLVDSPAKEIADESFMISTTDITSISELIKKEQIDGVLTGYIDSMLPFYNEVCKKNSLPCYITKKQIDITTDKKKFKNLCRQFNINVVEEYNVTLDSYEELEYPVLLKPVDNSGGKGIFICYKKEDFKELYFKSLSFSKSKQVLVERYMSCKEATIFYTIKGGEVYLTSVADRHVRYFDEGFIPLPLGYSFPSKHLELYIRTVDSNMKKMFKHLKMKDGMVFVQSFIENDRFIIYEMGYRLTGSIETYLFEATDHFNPLKQLISFAVGDKIKEKGEPVVDGRLSAYGANITFLCKPGIIKRIEGFDCLENKKNIVKVFMSYKEGDEIPEEMRGTLGQVLCRIILKGNSPESIREEVNKICKGVSVISTEGEEMLLSFIKPNILFS